MNKKGFAVSGMIYAILVLFLILVFSILSILGSRKLTFDKLKKDVLTHLNDSVSSSVLNFSYSGKIQAVTLKPGVYKLEAWGAQGGNIGSYIGGYGGYSQGEITLIEETTLYIGVGGEGTNSDAGGFNGGGSLTSGQSSFGASGGGATHISTINKTLPLLENDKDSILIVAGGGGGANYRGEGYGEGNGGSGGGFTGSNGNSVNHTNGYGYGYGYGGTQSSGGSRFWESSEEEDNTKPGVFGQGGGTEVGSTTQSGGGGGYYGGGASGHGGAGGGSGYIGNPLLTNKIMYCYNCSEQNEGTTRTKSTGDVSDKPIEWYAKQGNGFAKITKVSNVNEPNKPELLDNMVPIKYENEKWLVADTNQKWYDYNNKEWANAVVLNSGVTKNVGNEVTEEDVALWYVWIPRYKYTIFNGNNGSVSEQLINVTFETDINKTGTVTCSDNADGSETCTDNTYGGITNGTSTYTHPAFKFGNTELTGFWVGKFEVSGSTSAITVKPNVTSLRSQTVSSFFTAIQNVKTTYGINNADSHMLKNMEWGAVAYLKQSKYGLGATDIAINDSSSYYTGGGTSDAYKTNVAQSTTGNIYGVYDMSGGAWEYVMGNMKNSSNAFYSSNAGFTTAPDAKYYDSYKYDSSSNKTHARGKLGDATKETLATFGSNAGGWYSDYAYFPNSSRSWFLRGGRYNLGTSAGVFKFNINDGDSDSAFSARAVLTAE